MKLAVSNIAWAVQDRDAAYALLRAHAIDGLEIAPGLFLDGAADVFAPTPAECARAMAPLRAAGLRLVSMQALLFGVQGAALFGDTAARAAFMAGMHRAIALAGALGIPHMVFGSPRQRVIPGGMTSAVADAIAQDVFDRLGDAAQAAGTRLGVEFNPVAYGTNFLNTAAAAADFAARLNHPGVGLVLDVGAMQMNGDFGSVAAFCAVHAPLISHVHLSAPALAPAPDTAQTAMTVFAALQQTAYQGWYSVEMKAGEMKAGEMKAVGSLASLERSLGILTDAAAHYDRKAC